METLATTARTTLKRHPERGSFDRALVHSILDEGLLCHLGFAVEGQPVVIPTTYARAGDRIYVHGAVASRMLKTLRQGVSVCFSVSLLDGLVLARSAMHHSMNYRSVVVFGVATEVVGTEEKKQALEAIVEHIIPGRSADVRGPCAEELRATLVLSLPITEASAKVRTGPPVDIPSDYGLPCWAGVVPLRLRAEPPEPDPQLAAGISLPRSIAGYARGAA
jgi:nitroimidazol reductase NimA-like FMN-containing flavoprotein (pyridoxamine 5'-phosphate oxidase superfamily)